VTWGSERAGLCAWLVPPSLRCRHLQWLGWFASRAADIVAAQLDHIVALGHQRDRTTIRVLRLDARIEGHAVPRSAFFLYSYPDDPDVVAVDTVTSDLVLIESTEVRLYRVLYDRLRDAALSPSDSLDFLATVAEDLTNEGDRHDHIRRLHVRRLA
jgi:hypothetical protein